MALLYMDGFDVYDDLADLQAAGVTTTGITFSASGGRFGGGCLVGPAGSTGYINYPVNFAPGDVAFTTFSYFQPASAASLATMFELRTAADVLLGSISVDSAGALTFTPNLGSTVSGISSVPLGSWVRVEIKLTLGTSASTGAMEVKINGTTALTASAVDTHNGNNGTVLRIWAARDTGRKVDDIVIFTGAGAAPNAYLGDLRIDTLRPTADGAVVDWTANGAASDFQCVDDALQASNGDTDYIASNTVSQKSRFTMGDVSGTSAATHAVQPRWKAKKTDAGARTYRAYIRSSTSEANGDTLDPSTAYNWSRNGVFVTDPNGGGALDDTVVNGLEMGVELVA